MDPIERSQLHADSRKVLGQIAARKWKPGRPVKPGTTKLGALRLSNAILIEGSEQGTSIGMISGMLSGSSLSLLDNAGGHFQLNGPMLEAGPTATDFEASSIHPITLRETSPGVSNSPRDTVLEIIVKDVADGPALVELAGSFTLSEHAVPGDVAGVIDGVATGSTLSVINDAGGRVALSGSMIVAGSTALDYESASSHSFTVRETLAGSPNSPRDTILTLAVSDVADGPVLSDLFGSFELAESAIPGALAGNISGTTDGSTLSLPDDAGGRVALSGSQIVAGATPLNFASATTHSFTIRETLEGSANSPHETILQLAVLDVAEGASLADLSGDFALPENAVKGDLAGVVAGTTSGSQLSLLDSAGGRVQLEGTSIVAGATALDYENSASHSFTIRETLAGSPNSPRDSVLTLAVLDVADGAALTALTGTFALLENSIAGEPAGGLDGVTTGSTLSLIDDAGGRIALVDATIVAGVTPLDYESASSHEFTIRETLANLPNSPRDTVLTLTVFDAADGPLLSALHGTFELAESAAEGDVAGVISGMSEGSALSLLDDAGGRVALSGESILLGASPLDFETASSHQFTVRETLEGSSNSPRDTVFTLTVTDTYAFPTLNSFATLPDDTFMTGLQLAGDMQLVRHQASEMGEMQVTGGLMRSVAGRDATWMTTATIGGDQWAYVDLVLEQADPELSPGAVLQIGPVDDSFYQLRRNGAAVEVLRVVGGTPTTLASWSVPTPSLGETETLDLRIIGMTLTASHSIAGGDLTLVGTVTDDTPLSATSAARIGLRAAVGGNFNAYAVAGMGGGAAADAPAITLPQLAGTFSLAEGSGQGTSAGTLTGFTPGATLSLVDDAGGRVQLNGTTIEAGPTVTDFEASASHSFTVSETLAPYAPTETTLTLDVSNLADAPSLSALSGSFILAENAIEGAGAGMILGTSAGSTLELVTGADAGGRVQLAGKEIQRGSTQLDYETGTSHSFTVRETLADSPNSPRETELTLAVTDVLDTAPAITSASTVSVSEGQKLRHDLTADHDVTWSKITGTLDAKSISLGGARLLWSKDGVKDHEAPDDYNKDNVYEVLVRATNAAGLWSEQTVTITVTDVLEVPALKNLTGTFDLAESVRQGTQAGLLQGVTDGSLIELVDDAGGRVQLNGLAIEQGTTPLDYASSASHAFTVRETLAGSPNSPLETVLTLSVAQVTSPTPVITSASAISVPEGEKLAHTLTSDQAVTWSKVTGTLDADKFVLGGSPKRVLRWTKDGVKDYSAPDSYDLDNVYEIAVRATNADGLQAEQTISVAVTPASQSGAEKGADAAPYAIFITSDQDSRPNEERDDNIANVFALLRQDIFNLTGIVSNEPNGLAESYGDMFAAYEATRPQIEAKYPDLAHRFKTEAELLALVKQGQTRDAGPDGYWKDEASTPDTGVKRLIAAAVEHGDPDTDWKTNPESKLWLMTLGGYSQIAQACYEAIELGAQPDFLKRIVVVGYVTYNAARSENCWNYLINGYDHGKGPFGDLVMINGMHNWYYFGEKNPTMRAYWQDIIRPAGPIGDYMEFIRLNSGYAAEKPHAGDAGAYLWLLDAHERGEFDPTVAGNVAGRYQIDDGRAPTWGTSATHWPTLQSWGPTIYNAVNQANYPSAEQITRFGKMLEDAFSGLNTSASQSRTFSPEETFALAESGNPSLGTPGAWSRDVMEVPLSNATDGVAYQLLFDIEGGTSNVDDYFMLEASDADGAIIHSAKTSRYSWAGAGHTFDFIAPPGITKIVARRQPGFSGNIAWRSIKRIINTGNYAAPVPKANRLEPAAGHQLRVRWHTDPVADSQMTEPTVEFRGVLTSQTKMTEASKNRWVFTAGNAKITCPSSHWFERGNQVTYFTSEPAGGVPTCADGDGKLYVFDQGPGWIELSTQHPDEPGATPIVPTTSVSSGVQSIMNAGRSFQLIEATLSGHDEVMTAYSHEGVFARGCDFSYGNDPGNVTLNLSTIGKRGGTASTYQDHQFPRYDYVVMLDSYFDGGFQSHAGRFSTTAKSYGATFALTSGKPTRIKLAGWTSTTADNLLPGLDFTLSNRGGSLPAGLSDAATYYVKEDFGGGEVTFSTERGENAAAIELTDTGTGTHTLNVRATSNAGTAVPEGNPNNEGAPYIWRNIVARRNGDAAVDSKHPNAWISNVTIPENGSITFRSFMVHDYTMADPAKGKGVMALQGLVCPDFGRKYGHGTPYRMSKGGDGRCVISVFDNYIGGEKVHSLAHAVARRWIVAGTGTLNDANLPVYTMPIPDEPERSKWPVLAVGLQVRRSGTTSWYDLPVPYAGPFPAGALDHTLEPVGVGGIVADDQIDVRLGHFDGATWQWASGDGVGQFTTLTLAADT